jgi:branched-chain amino acid aminotransferase
MAEPGGMMWLNGGVVAAAQARIDPADRGLLLGDGIFETIAVRDSHPRDLDRHFARLSAGAALLRLPMPFDASQMEAASHAVLAANGLTQGALRITLTRGAGPRGVLPAAGMAPTLMITAASMPPISGTLSAIIAQHIRRDETSPLSAIKSLNYLPNILARIEAAERGADDALLLNQAGRLAEASAGNLFVLRDGVWLTPLVAEGALPGVRRARLLAAGMLRETRIELTDLDAAAAICIGNVLGLRAVVTLNARATATNAAAVAALSAV